jgi:chorismate--pyruvate lyase
MVASESLGEGKKYFPDFKSTKKARIFKYIRNKPIGWFLFQRTDPHVNDVLFNLKKAGLDKVVILGMGVNLLCKKLFLPAFEQFIRQH